ncbi:hypothetical protein [Comamonas sp. UBA7528]|uniref:hypothetical protein n=1 Tax=Comamonas sp. UBA7528 TaxID=1946391 RepID=UPI0025BDFB24|nr:hypothetical protein [Comamonas sp. UBA7528]
MSVVKSQVVSVRVEPHIKAALQSAAEREMRSLANMIEVMVVTYCRAQGYPLEGVSDETLSSTSLRRNAA